MDSICSWFSISFSSKFANIDTEVEVGLVVLNLVFFIFGSKSTIEK